MLFGCKSNSSDFIALLTINFESYSRCTDFPNAIENLNQEVEKGEETLPAPLFLQEASSQALRRLRLAYRCSLLGLARC